MGLDRPFFRTVRPFVEATNSGYSARACISDAAYAPDALHYIRAYLMVQKDLEKLFEYIEPSDAGAAAYSFRIHELLMRTCIEVEANFKAILSANGYSPTNADGTPKRLQLKDYKKVNASHHLYGYTVTLPIWNGNGGVFKPFLAWSPESVNADGVGWYQSYNASKHDRHEAFREANLLNLVSAVAGLQVLLTAQFRDETFSSGTIGLAVSGYDHYDGQPSIGDLFRVKYPDDWEEEEQYDFDWMEIKGDPDRFKKLFE